MRCADAEQFFDAHLDGELAGSLRLEFDAHRLRCPLCQQKLAMMEACTHLLSAEDDAPAASSNFTDQLMKRLEGPRVIRIQRRKLRIAGVTTLLATAAAFLVVAFVGQFGSTDSPGVAPGQPANTVIAGDFAAHPDLDKLIESKDKVELYRYIWDRVNQMVAAGNRIKKDVDVARDYAWNLTLPESGADYDPANPLRDLLDAIAPANEREKELPAPDAPDQHIL